MPPARPAILSGLQATALQVVKDHFGAASECVCAALIRRSQRTLKELQADTELTSAALKNNLLVLIQHNLVSVTIDGSLSARECRYHFEVEEASLRLRYPKFCTYIKSQANSEHARVASQVMEAILEHGRANMAQIVEHCKYGDEDISQDKLIKAGNFLIQEKYIVRAQANMEKSDSPAILFSPTQKKTGKRKAASAGEERESKLVKLDSGAAGIPVKDEGALKESISNEGSTWRVNTSGFLWDFRTAAIAQLIEDRFGPQTASLMKLLLRTIRSRALQPANLANGLIPAASVDAMLAASEGKNEDLNVVRTWEVLSEQLSALCQDPAFKCVTKLMGGGSEGSTFKPDMSLLMMELRQLILESIVEKKFTARGRRIFRLLLERKYLESKTVWDLSMVPKKDANDILCKMLKAQYVRLQEVPRTIDHNTQRTFFLWYVDLPKVCSIVEDEMYRTINYLLLKREEKKRECENFIGVGGEVSDLTDKQMKKYQALVQQMERVNTAILRLDETIMVMVDANKIEAMEETRARMAAM